MQENNNANTPRKRRGKKKIELPLMPIGGNLPTKAEDEEIKVDTENKINKYISENPQRPDSDIKPINKPLQLKTDAFSIENEYIEIAKRYVGINPGRNPSMVEFARAVIKTIEEKDLLIKKLRMPRNDGIVRTLWSSEENGTWNTL